jgi:hypothetical protein
MTTTESRTPTEEKPARRPASPPAGAEMTTQWLK